MRSVRLRPRDLGINPTIGEGFSYADGYYLDRRFYEEGASSEEGTGATAPPTFRNTTFFLPLRVVNSGGGEGEAGTEY